MGNPIELKSTKHSASEIAKYFIWKSSQEKRPITNKKLQKLLYYAQVWYLVASKGKEKLFPEKIEAWIHGPVVPAVYHDCKEFGFGPIPSKYGSEDNISSEVKVLLDEVWQEYGQLDAETLESLTHSEPPWREARRSLDSDEFSNTEIVPRAMVDYYTSLKQRLEKKNDQSVRT